MTKKSKLAAFLAAILIAVLTACGVSAEESTAATMQAVIAADASQDEGIAADAHGKTPAQIILRWHLQAGFITIPGSQNPDHILENFSIFDFELTEADMQQMAALHTGMRYENW